MAQGHRHLKEIIKMLSDNAYANLSPQQKRVYDYLFAGHTLTTAVAEPILKVGSLSSRIAELRKLGASIAARAERGFDGRMFYKYDLIKEAS